MNINHSKHLQREAITNILNLFLFFTAAFCVFVHLHTSLIIIPHYVLEIGGSEFDAGMQTAVFFLSAIFFRIYLGPMTDLKGRKIPLLIGTFTFTTAPLFFFISSNMWLLIAARIYQAVGLAAFLSTGSSFVADSAPAQKVGTYLGAYRIINIAALLSGPPLATLAVSNMGFSNWFLLSSILSLIAVPAIALLKSPKPVSGTSAGSLKLIYYSFKQKSLRPAFIGIFLTALGYGTIINFSSLFITNYSDITNPGLYFTYMAAAGIAANIGAGYLSDRFGRQVIVWPAVTSLGLGITILLLLPQIQVIFFLSSILTGIGFFGGMLALIAWLIDLSAFNVRGTVLAIQENIIDFSIGVGAFLFGASSTFIGMPLSFTGLGIIILIPGLYMYFSYSLSRKKHLAQSNYTRRF